MEVDAAQVDTTLFKMVATAFRGEEQWEFSSRALKVLWMTQGRLQEAPRGTEVKRQAHGSMYPDRGVGGAGQWRP